MTDKSVEIVVIGEIDSNHVQTIGGLMVLAEPKGRAYPAQYWINFDPSVQLHEGDVFQVIVKTKDKERLHSLKKTSEKVNVRIKALIESMGGENK